MNSGRPTGPGCSPGCSGTVLRLVRCPLYTCCAGLSSGSVWPHALASFVDLMLSRELPLSKNCLPGSFRVLPCSGAFAIYTHATDKIGSARLLPSIVILQSLLGRSLALPRRFGISRHGGVGS